MLLRANNHALLELFLRLPAAYRAHSENVARYCCAMMSVIHRSSQVIEPVNFSAVHHACWLHDIGKALISEAIINKPGSLDEAERMVIEEHPRFGVKILKDCAASTGMTYSKENWGVVAAVVYNHHERWDGRGYPDGLQEDEIPLVARVCCIADAYDAITSERPYSKAASKEKALEIINECAGAQFDPWLVEILMVDTFWANAARRFRKEMN